VVSVRNPVSKFQHPLSDFSSANTPSRKARFHGSLTDSGHTRSAGSCMFALRCFFSWRWIERARGLIALA
jgi:hypothetical protein